MSIIRDASIFGRRRVALGIQAWPAGDRDSSVGLTQVRRNQRLGNRKNRFISKIHPAAPEGLVGPSLFQIIVFGEVLEIGVISGVQVGGIAIQVLFKKGIGGEDSGGDRRQDSLGG